MNERDFTVDNIDKSIAAYKMQIEQIPLVVSANTVYELLQKLKRGKLSGGPHPGVSLFEAANRIMTSLTILYGIRKLLHEPLRNDLVFDCYKANLGNECTYPHDIMAENNTFKLYGEAFNVAESFFGGKKSSSLKKLRSAKTKPNEILLLMYNADARPGITAHDFERNEFYIPVEMVL